MARIVALNSQLVAVILTVLESLETDTLNDESFAKLGALFSEKLVLSALDLVDRETVTKYILPFDDDSPLYEVMGTTATYIIQLDLPAPIPFYCSCPAFLHSVLTKGEHVMCKHLLAALISRKMSACVERPITADELVEVYRQQHPTSLIE